MAYYKCTFFFNHPRAGWSETYYTNQTSLNAASNFAGSLGVKRTQLLCPPATWEAVRVANDANPRETLTAAFVSTRYTSVEMSDTPWQAALIRLVSQFAGVKRQLYMRGIPDEIWDTQSPNNATRLDWESLLKNTFFPQVVNNNWFIKTRTRPSALNKVPIATWLPTPNEHESTITFNPATAIIAGDKLQIYNVKGFPAAPGIVNVTSSVPLGGSARIQLHTPNDFTYIGQAYFVKYDPQYLLIDFAQLGPIVHRDVGRPFGLQRGRRRAIKR